MRFALSPRPIRSVLIANRGEIAIRVMRTCGRLGLRSIAVYSDADAAAAHVTAAHEAVRIGPSPARESYLNIDAIIGAALATGADAIHPGYGFLSENAEFVRACEQAGVIFVGPSADAVARMGSKIEAKRVAQSAGVPIVPGYHEDAQDLETLSAAAARIGYPVLIKASAGGGGRGMRRVDLPEEFAPALQAARSEAQAAFGDATVLLEKFIAAPRHIEVQVMGDRHGHLVHIFERDCSVQRNNQKIIEEAPAPHLADRVRQLLQESALKLCRAIGYDSAGTVEFIMEAGDDRPYFLEMNTRLQVEHPVTEMITGIDLVEWQLLAAAGEPIPAKQSDIHAKGHAIEVRITAERADRAFQPASGRVLAVSPPHGARFDNGVAAGSAVSLFYDSLLAKLIAYGPDRDATIRRLTDALKELSILGLPTTQPFLRDCLLHPLFATGPVTTRFISTAFGNGWSVGPGELRTLRALAAACWIASDAGRDAVAIGSLNPWLARKPVRVTRSVRPATTDLLLSDDYGEAEVQARIGRSGVSMAIDGEQVELGHISFADGCMHLDGLREVGPVAVRREDDRVALSCKGLSLSARLSLKIDTPRSAGTVEHAGDTVTAPLHGLISEIYVGKGDAVAAGDSVVQMEAMKLIHTLKAPVDGTVEDILCAVGETVPAGAVLIKIGSEFPQED